jgi:hypothetical protein
MRIVLLACVAALALSAFVRTDAMAAGAVRSPGSDRPLIQAQEVDDNDDTRVEVQLAVLAVVIGTVFVAGTGVYLLRRRLGLVAPPPEQEAEGHH